MTPMRDGSALPSSTVPATAAGNRLIRGTYRPAVTIELPPGSGVTVHVPMIDANDGHATAHYVFQEKRESSGRYLWRLSRIEETVPPMSPQEQARRFTEDAELPPLTPDGRIDWERIAARRHGEWAESET